MTTTAQADHEHPQYVTKADLEAFEGRIINRIGKLEKRMVSHRDLLVTALAIMAVNLTVIGISATALFFAVSNLTAVATAVLGKLP